MRLMKFNDSNGSALAEFLVFVVLGQILVLTGSMQANEWIDKKVRLELFAQQLARAESLGKANELFNVLKFDYRLQDATVKIDPCGTELVCLTAIDGAFRAYGVSLKNG